VSVALVTVTLGPNMPCKGMGWSTTIGAMHSLRLEATCATCYHAGWRCQYGVR
jgi:hypothetical protein